MTPVVAFIFGGLIGFLVAFWIILAWINGWIGNRP